MGGGGGRGVDITANTKILGHLAANSKKFAVTVKINKWKKTYTKIEKMAFYRMVMAISSVTSLLWFSLSICLVSFSI